MSKDKEQLRLHQEVIEFKCRENQVLRRNNDKLNRQIHRLVAQNSKLLEQREIYLGRRDSFLSSIKRLFCK